MQDGSSARLRLKLPTGAELEVEGTPEFVKTERETFLQGQREGIQGAPEGFVARSRGGAAPGWESLVGSKGPDIQLRAKLGGEKAEKDACLVLLAGAEKILRLQR